MESAGGKMKIKVNYVVYAPVKRVEWRNHPDGWFVQFEGSWESLNFGITPPEWSVGDTVKITFERVDDAESIPTQIPEIHEAPSTRGR